MTAGANSAAATDHQPLDAYADCHRGIVCALRAFSALPDLAAAASHARRVASKRAAAGIDARIDGEALAALVYAYNRHVAFEEMVFLPLAAEILGRNGQQMAALGLAIHLRHAIKHE